ncbi:phage tail assembly chaperone [Pseudomonas sp. NBRC 111135]|uniref:phage tail assembly chaperone n=1 Tax=Pseudomonas sp. NBRC 111135 TaxID=1661050 RepID=UPI003F8D0B33
MEQIARVIGEQPPELQTPPIPDELAYLLGVFFQIRRSPDPLTYTELRNWSLMTHQELEPLEVEAIMRLDAIATKVRHND